MLSKVARRQVRQRTCDVIVRSVRANTGGFHSFSEAPKSGDISRIWGNHRLRGKAVTLVVQENISLIINIALSERVTEFSIVVRTQ